MPTVTVTDVVTEAQAMLNDSGAAIFTLAKLLPFVNKAYDELQNAYLDNGVQVLDTISATVDVAANTTSINPQVAIGTNFVEPVDIYERADGSTDDDDWVIMDEKAWDPLESKRSTLDVWIWQEQLIKFRGSTAAREIQVFFKKALSGFTQGTDNIGIERAKTYLAARAAALAAGLIGENWTRAEVLQTDAELHKETLLSINAKKRQNIPIRKRGFRRPRRRVVNL